MISQCMKWLCTLAGKKKKMEEACLIKCKDLVIHHWFSSTVHLTKPHAKCWARVLPFLFSLNSSQLYFITHFGGGKCRARFMLQFFCLMHPTVYLGKMDSVCSFSEMISLDCVGFFCPHGLAGVQEGLDCRAVNWLTGRQVTSGADWITLYFEDILRQNNANSLVQLNETRSWHMTRLLPKMKSLPRSLVTLLLASCSLLKWASHSDSKCSSSVFRYNHPRWDNSTWIKLSHSFNILLLWATIAFYLTALVLVKWKLGRCAEDITENTLHQLETKEAHKKKKNTEKWVSYTVHVCLCRHDSACFMPFKINTTGTL